MAPSRWASVFCLGFLLSAGSAAADVHVVQMTTVNFEPRFIPAEITIRPGDTVQWINVDPFGLDHAVTSGTGSADPLAGTLWVSGTLHFGEYFERKATDYERWLGGMRKLQHRLGLDP